MSAIRLLGALGISALAMAVVAGMGAAINAAPAVACPDPKTAPLGKSVGIRGYTACNDGASALAVVGGVTYRFSGGVCWKDSTLPLNVDIGTIVHDRTKKDPAGFGIIQQRKGSPISDSASFGLTKASKVLEFRGAVKLTFKGRLRATFKGTVLREVNGKAISGTVPVTGSFTCKRLLVVPG